MIEPLVLVEYDGPVAVISLNRPDRHNSLVPELLEQLIAGLESVAEQPEVRAVVLAAEGPSFSTGGDVRALSEQGDETAAYASRFVGLLNDAILAMIDLPVPIVAAVHGMVTGGSLGLVLASDIVLVADEASFTPWYSIVGYAPDGGWTAMLPHIIGRATVADVLMRNRMITAHEAAELGLAMSVVPGIGIRHEALAVASEVSGMLPSSIRATKALLWADRDAIAAGLDAERVRFVEQIVTVEAREGMRAFLGM